MNAVFATTLISHEDFVAGLVVLQAHTLENPINAIDAERDSHRNKAIPNRQPANGRFRSLDPVG